MTKLSLPVKVLAALLAAALLWVGAGGIAGAAPQPQQPQPQPQQLQPQQLRQQHRQQSTDFIVGTYTIAANSTTESISNAHLVQNLTPPCQDCDITSLTPDLTDTSGHSVNMDTGPMLHHVVLYQQGATDVSCPTATTTFGMKRLFASGNERTELPPVRGYGLYIEPTEQWAALTDLMNYSSTPKTVQVRFHVTWQHGNHLKQLTPVWLDVTGCGGSFFQAPAGASHQTATWTSTINGKIIGLGGHLHEYGIHIQATDETAHQLLCDSKETQMNMPGGMVMVTSMSRCVGPPPRHVIATLHKGDKIQLDSYYNTPMAEEAMGIMMMYVDQKA
jgi:hypothetical protein